MSYIYIFLFSFWISLLLTFALKNAGSKYKLFDIAPEDDALKIHKKPITYLGGLAMAITIFLVLSFLAIGGVYVGEIFVIILGSIPVFALGFWDDLRWKNIPQPKPYRKFICLIIVPLISAFILSLLHIKVSLLGFIFADYLVTAFYMFVLVNSINYEDGIDGLAGGLSLLSIFGFLILSLITNNELSSLLSLIVAGSICGFMIFNFPPAKVFMGDSGAFFLGYILCVFAMFFSGSYDIISFIGIIMVLGFPVFEGVFTNIRRILTKKSIFFGDREHLYDRLYLKKGLTIKMTLLICYSIQVIFIIMGIILLFYGNTAIKT